MGVGGGNAPFLLRPVAKMALGYNQTKVRPTGGVEHFKVSYLVSLATN